MSCIKKKKKKKSITPKEAVDVIKKSFGKAVLAHPVTFKYEDNLDLIDIQKLVDGMKPDEIEANYLYVDKNNIIN